jgi:hypothetical protein
MASREHHERRRGPGTTAGLLLCLVAACQPRPANFDRLPAELDRWSAFVETASEGDDLVSQVKQSAAPLLTASRDALAAGRPLLATERLLAAAGNLGGAEYLAGLPSERRQDLAALEAEWQRLGAELGSTPPAADLAALAPAALRALAEVAVPQVAVYHEASLDYGRNTMAEAGFFYLGAARAQREVTTLASSLAPPPAAWWERRPGLATRSYAVELDRLEGELLGAYQPPLSIDRHGDFIVASSLLKEARELDAAGLRHGALLRTLQAARRVQPLTAAAAGREQDNRTRSAELAASVDAFAAELAAAEGDSSVGQLLVEIARANLESAAEDGSAPDPAATVVDAAIPLYAELLGPAPPAPPAVTPQAAVTLVRWPYT